ncbi:MULTISPECIES: hypothetical protein [Cyanophyceae]|uniref:hypothetical protein n=1 Tax=Cyanophyceae TaxID=3028117 RepID=UPI00232AD44F|nr:MULTISPECIES: hypothetical protein [Cyanophyceae]MDB9355462.1 hypothetical protein [Nodularia spumigena CS-587/03]MDB9323963.1 hypothetical protein [Nodularia spumigena CS-591/07A]MDB9332464.1 hypothetical protein [Nodularia spumigena CS-591/04]MDB9341339.1 hypothetical protein [Nodularia spumigena CS-589/07]MDB9361304.1 hypothetical protein [Nodularia spumigena CS-588/02]
MKTHYQVTKSQNIGHANNSLLAKDSRKSMTPSLGETTRSEGEIQSPSLAHSYKQAEHYGHHIGQVHPVYISSHPGVPQNRAKSNSHPGAIQMMKRSNPQGTWQSGTSKKRNYEQMAEQFPDKTANQLVQEAHNQVGKRAMIAKGFPNIMGDHSPSIDTLNKADGGSGGLHVNDRPIKDTVSNGKTPISEKDLLTHFSSDKTGKQADFTPDEQKLGKEHHTMLTTLREAGGTGEGKKFKDTDDLLDKTLYSYAGSPKYPGSEELVKSQVRRADGKPGNVLIKPVAPAIAQAVINMDHRNKRDRKNMPLIIRRNKR